MACEGDFIFSEVYMIPAEQRKKLEELHEEWATQSYDGYASSAYIAGAEAAWEMREAEIAEVKKRAENSIRNIQDELDRSIAEAVKAERERIESELADGKFLSDVLWTRETESSGV